MNKTEERYARFGMAIAEITKEYWFSKVVRFIAGEDTQGGMYLEHLKPLYDKYGYTKVNNFLIKIYKEKAEANNE